MKVKVVYKEILSLFKLGPNGYPNFLRRGVMDGLGVRLWILWTGRGLGLGRGLWVGLLYTFYWKFIYLFLINKVFNSCILVLEQLRLVRIGPRIVVSIRFWSRIVASIRVSPELSRLFVSVSVLLNFKRTDP